MHTSDTVYSDFFVCQKICDNGKNVYFFYLGQSFLQFIKKILMANNTGCNFSVLNILQILNHHKNYPIKGT